MLLGSPPLPTISERERVHAQHGNLLNWGERKNGVVAREAAGIYGKGCWEGKEDVLSRIPRGL